VAALAISFAIALAPGAQAGTKVFDPVRTTARDLVFEPRVLAPHQVRSARVLLHIDGESVVRPVPAAKVRQALRTDSALTVRRIVAAKKLDSKPTQPASERASDGTLRVRADRSGAEDRNAGANDAGANSDEPADDSGAYGTSCALGGFSSTNMPGACWRPYSDQSPFNRPVEGGAAANSEEVVSRVMSFSPTPDKFAGGTAGTAADWSHPIYFSEPTDPTYTIECTESWGTCEVEGMQIRIPADAEPAGGSDGHLAVIDQASGWEYDFWQVQSKPAGGGTMKVSWGGRTAIAGAGADGLGSEATASEFGLAAGVIRPAELAAGEINHALFMGVRCTNGTAVYPAAENSGRACSDIGLPNAGAPAMGQRFYLDMSETEIGALPAPDWQKTILRAAARYGMYVGDTGSGGWALSFESGSSFTSFDQDDPWAGLAEEFGLGVWRDPSLGRDLAIYDFRGAVDWSRELKVAAPPQ